MTAVAMASSTAISKATSPNMVTLQKGFSFTTSPSRNFCSLTTNSKPISSLLSFQASSSRFLVRVELLSATPKVDHSSKTNAFTEALKAVEAVDSVKSTLTENEIVRNSEASVQQKVFRQEKNPKRLNSSASQRNTLDHYQILKYPLRSELAIQNIVSNNTLVFVVDKRADKKNIRDAVEKMFKIQTRKVNTLNLPDGTKKAYLMLKPSDNASDIAKKIKIF